MKSFQEGDQVIVLAPENSDKMCNRWLGPGTVVKVKSLHSYLIDLGNDNVRHLHANKMRHFVPVYKVVASLLSVIFNSVKYCHPMSYLAKVLYRVLGFFVKKGRASG